MQPFKPFANVNPLAAVTWVFIASFIQMLLSIGGLLNLFGGALNSPIGYAVRLVSMASVLVAIVFTVRAARRRDAALVQAARDAAQTPASR